MLFSERSTIFINCGGPAGNGSISDKGLFKAQVPDYYSTERNVSTPLYWKQAWRDSLKSHRYALLGDLEYSIPAEGAYKLTLFFAEIWTGAEKPGTREFTVTVNDVRATFGGEKRGVLDVVRMAGGTFRGFALQRRGQLKVWKATFT